MVQVWQGASSTADARAYYAIRSAKATRDLEDALTPDGLRRQWYQEMADFFTPVYECEFVPHYEAPLEADVAARLAGHFGRLALGRVARVDWDEAEDNQRQWREAREQVEP
jgi:hypothetical protein